MKTKDKEEILDYIKDNLKIKLHASTGSKLSQVSNNKSVWDNNTIYVSVYIDNKRISISETKIKISE